MVAKRPAKLVVVLFGALATACGSANGSSPEAPGPTAGDDDAGLLDAPVCLTVPDYDHDGDGWTPAEGDCDDCNPRVNPGAYDFPGDGRDDDCSGTADDEPSACDDGIALDDLDARNGARAIGLCRTASASPKTKLETTWGVVGARWVTADGGFGMNDLSHGFVDDFGPYVNPQEGDTMLLLSTGPARRPKDPDFADLTLGYMGTEGPTPPGFPWAPTFCPTTYPKPDPGAKDPAGLELKIRVPTNAGSFSFDFDFYTTEYPAYVCSISDDYFVVLLKSQAPNPNAKDDDISFDSKGNAISVNSGLLDVCQPRLVGDRDFECPLGTAGLVGTGFEARDGQAGHAATGWLKTTAPVLAGEVMTIRFVVWDSEGGSFSSSVLIDHFAWNPGGASGSDTGHVPNPR